MRTRTAVIATSCLLTTAAFAAPRMFDFDASVRFGGYPFPSYRVMIDGQTYFPNSFDTMPNALDSSPASQAFGAANMNVSGRFAYDTDTAPFAALPNFSNYRGSMFQLDVALPGGGSFVVSKSDPIITVANDTGFGDRISISTSFEALDAPFTLANMTDEFDSTSVDLLSDTEIASMAPGLPALDHLWVRLTPPSEINFETMSLVLRDPTETALGSNDLPGSINYDDFDMSDSVLVFQFESLRGFEVLRDDYDSDADFQLASDWVD
ncbi:MAG: hypothetical protein ACTS27_07465, partial [Phycisphaerales bacterium]